MSSTVRSLKGLITKRNDAAVNWLQDSIQAPMDIQLKESARRIKTCDGYIELLEASLTKLTKAFDETPETTEEEEDHLDKYIEKTHATIMKLHEHRRHLEETQEGNTGIDTDGVTSQAVVNKLPTIPIPTFTGRKWEWDNFWALYKANIHDQNLSQLQKFNYLLKSLSGEAKQSVSRFFISANNYEKAIQHLVKRYGNKDGIVLELNKSLHNCMAKGPSTTEQRQLWDKLSTIAAQLEEHEQHLDNQLTVQIFIQKFHVRIRKAAMEKRIRHQEEHGSEWTLNQWLDAIDKVISQEEQLNHMLSVEGQFRSYSLHSGTAVRAYPKETKATWKAEVSCECCKTRGHRWTNCPKIPKAIQKRRFLIETNRCLNCGSSSHRIASCPSGNCRNCHKKHHTSICTDGKMMEPEHRGKLPPGSQKYIERKPFKNEIKVAGKPGLGHSSKQHTVSKRIVEYRVPNHPTVDDESGKEDTSETPLVLQLKKKNEQKQNKVILLTGAVRIISAEGDSREVAVLLDTGSELSFIEDQLATELKLPIVGTTMLELNTFGSPLSQRKSCAITYLTLMDREGTEHKVRLYRNDYITCGIQQASLDRDDLEFIQKGNFHLSLPIKEGEIKPQILLGCDYLWNFIEPGDKLNLPSGLQLINSKLGYIISGQQRQQSQRPTITCTFQGHETERETWERYWSLESSGTEEYTGPQQTELQKVNEKVLKDFKESIEKREDGYYVRLPWKEDQPQLPDNWTLALKRLKKVLETYQRDTDILRAYDKVFKDQLETGVIEEVNSDEAEGHIIHYLPHQAVITPARETTKIRIVFDASAHYKDSPCLNDVLHQGPLILPDLVGIILRFRLHNIAVISDIEKAFLQVRLQERDRDATRCIWVKNITQPPTPENLVIYRFTRVTFGLNASPFLLSATINHHLESTAKDDDMAPEIRQNLYVDNLFFGAQSSEEAISKYTHTKNLFRELNMNLREYRSNDKGFNEAIEEADRMKSSCPKVLGIPWNSETDKLIIKGSMIASTQKITKRTVTQQLASVYDPMGFMVPLLLPAKIFLQSLWKEQLDWDTTLNAQLQDQWRQISSEISTFYKEVHRKILRVPQQPRLVVFTDASQYAMAACAYLTTQSESEFIMGKSKLPSIKTMMTIPKLEINATTLGMRLARFICEALQSTYPIKEVICYTDSDIVLGWIRSAPTRQNAGVLVTNRLAEIRRINNNLKEQNITCLFGHVNTSENPADCASRGVTAEALQNHLWWNGPPFTNKPDYSKLSLIPQDEETTAALVETITTLTEQSKEEIIDLRRHSSLEKAQRVLVYVLRFLKTSLNHFSEKRKEDILLHIPALKYVSRNQNITGMEMQESRMCLIRDHQKQYVDEHQIKSQKELNIRQDEKGVLRCYGRLKKAQIPVNAKTPIYIAPRTTLARLIITETHRQYHRGVAHTIASVRETYWIPKLRQQVKNIIKECVPCQKINNLPFTYPDMDALPATRVRKASPFEHIGLDYFGPLAISDNHEGSNKTYGCIFTCQITRLVHLELVENMTTEAFLNALRRFFARRGVPRTITCDNAPTFLLGEQIIKDTTENMVHSTEFESEIARREIKWSHITPYAPWQGGFYERLIRSVKSSLHKTLGKRTITFDGLRTMITEIEAMLNSRPLTYQEEKWEEQPLIRPIDFLQHDILLDYPLKYMGEEGNDRIYHTAEEAQQLATQRQAEAALKTSIDLTEKFWRIWREQYLTGLREQHKIRMDEKRGTKKTPKIGDIVLLWDAVQPRNVWKTARIVGLDDSPSQIIREVLVETPNKRRFRRPINRIVPLEIDNEDDSSTIQKDKHDSPIEQQQMDSTAPYNFRTRKKIDYKEQEIEEPTQRKNKTSTLGVSSLFTMMCLSICIQSTRGISNSSHQQLQCNEKGVILTQLTGHPYEICAEDYCMEFQTPRHQEIVRFPAQITLHDYSIKWKTFDGTEVNIIETTCRAAPFCEQINCVLCVMMIANPECWPRIAIAVTGLIVYAVVATCYCIFHVPVLMGTPLLYCLKITGFCGKWVIKLIYKAMTKPFATTYRRQRRQFSLSEGAILLTVIVCTTRVQACQDVDIFTHHSRSCYKSEHGESCTIDTTEIMKINPFKQEACIQLRSKETNVIEIKLIWKGLDLICEKQTTVFTRSTKYALLDSKRCPHAGSCTGEKCGKVNRTFKVPELHRANHFPGITDCVESCGGPGCDCFYPSSGCLFYRIYLVPNDEKVYEFFKCNRWKQRVNLQLTVIEADESEQEYNFYVLPNQPKRILPFIVTLSSISTPPTPMLHSTFLTDGSRYAIAPTNFQPPLVCASQDDAMNLTCEVREECECTPAEVRMKCDCKEVNLTTHIREPHYTLPVIRPNLEFRAVNGTIISKIPQLPTAEFILRIQGRFNTTSMKSDAICTSDDTHCTGCYKCAKGARASLTCRSTIPTMAEIQCGDDAFTVPCNNTGVQTKISFISNKALFYRECTIKCGTTRNSFKITGLLHYTGSLQGAARRILEGESEVYSEINLPDFEHLARTFLTWWTTLAVTALIVVVALLVTYLAITNAFLCTVMTTILRILTTLFRLALYLLRVLGVLLFRCLCSHLIKKKEN